MVAEIEMKQDVQCRIIVKKPLANVVMKIQKGRDGLLEPSSFDPGQHVFKFSISVDLSSGTPNFLGPFVHGPKSSRFIYLNSGTYAGQEATCWGRRAKLNLISVTTEMVTTILADPGSVLETTLQGVGSDGAPVCASVKGLEWTVSK